MPKRFVITGAMGSGKSTVLKLLRSAGFNVIEEPARQILEEQRNIGDEGVPEKNPKIFLFPAWREIYTTDEEKKCHLSQRKILELKSKKFIVNMVIRLLKFPAYRQKSVPNLLLIN